MRSLLFIPADSEKKLAKGFASGADCLILDLEDSVAPEVEAEGAGAGLRLPRRCGATAPASAPLRPRQRA